MLRFLGFFALTFVVYLVLIRLPVIGSLASIPFLGFFLAAAIVSRFLTKGGALALDRRKQKALMRELGAVDTPHNKGKLGMLFLSQRRFEQAIPLLNEAVSAEPDSADLNYRLGKACLGAKQFDEAIAILTRAVEINEEHAYGSAMMRLGEAKFEASDPEGALEAYQRVERNHGPSPESAYRLGMTLKALGRKEEAVATLASVRQLAREAVGYQKRAANLWSFRAAMARLF
ncbi:MAG: tetratricopeptide (TPR) repeat protein [Planctomycetota bacterium]|jgi:tetratricopeptide (TPR) repeat protein